jgi:hypothetical protein
MPYEITIKIDSDPIEPTFQDPQAVLSELNRWAARTVASQDASNISPSHTTGAIGPWFRAIQIQALNYPPGLLWPAAQWGYLKASEFPSYTTIQHVVDRLWHEADFHERIWPGYSDLMEMLACVDSADDPGESKRHLWAAARRYSRRLLPEHLGLMARIRLREMGAASEVDEYSLILKHYSPMAIVFVIENSRQIQTVRLGEKWVKNRDGKKWRGRPCDLILGKFYLWVQREMYKACEAFILDLEYPRTNIDCCDDKKCDLDEDGELPSDTAQESAALHNLLIKQDGDRSGLLGLLTKRQREFLYLFAHDCDAPSAAEKMRLAESTGYVLLHQIRKKFSSISRN